MLGDCVSTGHYRYTVIAILCRLDIWNPSDSGSEAFDGGSILVPFMIVFFVSYCYSRYEQ